MIKFITLTFILFLSSNLWGQQNQRNEPFIIKGQIIDYNILTYKSYDDKKNDNAARISYSYLIGKTQFDTTYLDETGNFYYKTNKFLKPVSISLTIHNRSFGNLYAAPGFNITLIASNNATNNFLKLTGKGSEINCYTSIIDSLEQSKVNKESLSKLDEKDYLNYINKDQKFKDSVTHAIFDRNNTKDKYLKEMGEIFRIENMFKKLEALLNYGRPVKEGKLLFVENNFDKNVLNNPNNEEYLESSTFRNGINREYGSFLNFFIKYHNQKDSLPETQGLEFKLNEVNRIFSGEVRAYILYNLITPKLSNYTSVENLQKFRNHIKPLLNSLTPTYLSALDSKFSEQEGFIIKTEDRVTKKEAIKAETFIGKPAPPFRLFNNTGQTFSLEDFKSQVVLLNLWSSWCDICVEENKALNKLIQKYKNDKRLVFVSIAVIDDFDEWVKKLNENRLGGIQLIDKDRVVLNSYINEHVPKFILIDKQGNVVNFMAPKPSKGNELEKLINLEIEKK